MARISKSASASAPVSAAPAEPVKAVDPAAPPVKKERKAAAPKAEKKVAAPAVAVEQKAVIEVTDASAVDAAAPAAESSAAERLAEFALTIQLAATALAVVRAQYKVLEKSIIKDLKTAHKSSKRVKRAGNRQPSGFIRPTLISDELAAFLGQPAGTEIARTEVSKLLNQYIRANSLQDKENGRRIVPDAKLAALLRTTAEDVLTYFNLQRYMKPHFIKVVAPTA
jgi:chromatin remodeling complex protein RSC6